MMNHDDLSPSAKKGGGVADKEFCSCREGLAALMRQERDQSDIQQTKE